MRRTKALIVIALVFLMCWAGCARNRFDPAYTNNVSRIKLSRDGRIYLNGKQASLEEVKKDLEQRKAKHGAIKYYRENPQKEATTQALEVIRVIADAKLPVRFCVTEEELNSTD
jgi:biopolymer transport protein ExbD